MIVFLTLIYVAALFLLVKLGVIRLTLFWKLSCFLWMLLLFLVLFVPMQWGAPAGPVNVYQAVVEIIPNVAGEVVEVPVDGLQPISRGDVLFRIDPAPYQTQVDLMQSELEQARQTVLQLQAAATAARAAARKTEQEIDVLESRQKNAQIEIGSAEAAVRESQAQLDQARALVDGLQTEVAAALRSYERNRDLLAQQAISKTEYDQVEIRYTQLASQLNNARIQLRVATESVNQSIALQDSAQSAAELLDLQMEQLIASELPRMQALADQAELEANSTINGVHTRIASSQAKLDTARYNLEETSVRAPADGYLVGASLRPGQRVAPFPVRSFMSFVNQESTRVVVGINQFTMRYVQPGQPAEVTFKLYPGRVFPATVERIAWVTPQGQLAPSGNVPGAPNSGQQPQPFGVILKMEPDDELDMESMPGGTVGTAAIYTDHGRPTHIIRRVMVRMQAWMDYVIP